MRETVVQLAEWLAILALVALALAILIVARRAAKLLLESRDTARFREETADLVARIEQSLSGVGGRIDAVRRQTVPAESIAESIAAAREAVSRYEAEARALHGPGAATEIRDAIAAELERAARALEMVDHGCGIIASAVGGRGLEGQTSIKRGYLNVLHAREAISRHALRAASLGKREPDGLFERGA
ncbi:MAG TPA: hypothetical protein VH723_03630 [Candidatus Limnocylindrales bacterium]|jgi:hypothetical protein